MDILMLSLLFESALLISWIWLTIFLLQATTMSDNVSTIQKTPLTENATDQGILDSCMQQMVSKC